jgi:hypothetical protein
MPNFKLSFLASRGRSLAIAAVLGVAGLVAVWQSGALADPQSPPPSAAPTKQPPIMPTAEPIKPANAGAAASTASAAPAPAAPVVSDQAHIYFTTVPAAYATVTWGKKVLGRIAPRQALVVVRPRDSGPLDVVVRAAGYMPVQVRAHTFSDTRVAVKLTTVEQKSTLLGYRLPIDAGPEAGEPVPPPSDAGTPLLP